MRNLSVRDNHASVRGDTTIHTLRKTCTNKQSTSPNTGNSNGNPRRAHTNMHHHRNVTANIIHCSAIHVLVIAMCYTVWKHRDAVEHAQREATVATSVTVDGPREAVHIPVQHAPLSVTRTESRTPSTRCGPTDAPRVDLGARTAHRRTVPSSRHKMSHAGQGSAVQAHIGTESPIRAPRDSTSPYSTYHRAQGRSR